jgi:hypothetical protein
MYTHTPQSRTRINFWTPLDGAISNKKEPKAAPRSRRAKVTRMGRLTAASSTKTKGHDIIIVIKTKWQGRFMLAAYLPEDDADAVRVDRVTRRPQQQHLCVFNR